MTDRRGMHLHLDPVGGAAGDMFVAAMLDAFPDLESRVIRDIEAILPSIAGRPELNTGRCAGITVRRLRLVPGEAGNARHGEETTYRAMRSLIEAADLAPGTTSEATAILHRIAVAEAAVHGIPLDRVHFHEIADWDALMDVTAAGSICAALPECSWSVGALPLGSGRVKTAHGLLPVPAPATAEILQGYDWIDDGVPGERVTPTGAAILAHVTGGHGNGNRTAGSLQAIGSGAGTRDLPGLPNILRVTAFATTHGRQTDIVIQLACDIDDMTGEEIGWAAGKLRVADGLRDLVLSQAFGKKGRPVTRLEVLVVPEAEERIADMLFDLTTTLGLRRLVLTRHTLARRTVETPSGLRRKVAERPSGDTSKLESDDLADAPSLQVRRRIIG
ncbi:LarC family nickel insertion protein [Salipiger mucosus]|uniref:Nickel insertion protein n=1 Tax=Salipiger mucosus DSM 16094 TaxID=1123237 RepID=S9RIL0_9RHOB|nr:LarC family nickel insertion protein [Salipiger mucosus]EPX77955.1 hypothetical protein Salmuc_03277 [Salipiger mucosus DSM 16094]